MNVLVIGSGGREHALVWKLKQSQTVDRLVCAPGNAGIEDLAECVPVKATDVTGLAKLAEEKSIDLTVVGPEQPLVLGIVDEFEKNHRTIFGPSRMAARLEGSKAFAKDFMQKHGIPSARYKVFDSTQSEDAVKFAESFHGPLVVKADGLAAGKGVVICETHDAAARAIHEILDGKVFGDAGEKIVVEEFLEGEEASIFAICDGTTAVTLAPAQDHKRILDGDKGKNTGGMGAYAPAPIMTPQVLERVLQEIILPTLKGMKEEGSPYRGCLFVGLIMTASGPFVLEYNCRFGDPEAQAVLPLVDGDLAQLLLAAASGTLQPDLVRQHPATAVCVVMASRGYPDTYEVGKEIRGLDSVKPEDGEVVFHAGTKKNGESIVTAGGRVLGVTAIGYGHDIGETIHSAYRIVERITFDGAYFRSDIGRKALKGAHLPARKRMKR